MQTLLYFLLWAGAIFLMMRVGCGAHITGHGHRSGQPRGDGTDGPGASGRVPATEIDPVCGMTVETATAKPSFFDGSAYFFCSEACRDKFEAAPASYTKAIANQRETMEVSHGGTQH